MTNFDMRIPIRDLKVLRRTDGRIVLELQSAFDSVDPIVVEMPESVLSNLLSARVDPRDPHPGSQNSFRAPLASGVQRPANDAPTQATWSGDTELTEEEIAWLARSAG